MITKENLPTYEYVNDKVSCFMETFGNITTIEQLKNLVNQSKYAYLIHEIEINGEPFRNIIDKISDDEIEWIRYENYDCLDYIYIWIDGKNKHIFFDIWLEDYEDYLITDLNLIDFNKANYNKWINEFIKENYWIY